MVADGPPTPNASAVLSLNTWMTQAPSRSYATHSVTIRSPSTVGEALVIEAGEHDAHPCGAPMHLRTVVIGPPATLRVLSG